MKNSLILVLLGLTFWVPAEAIVHRQLPSESQIRGGEAGSGFTLLGYRRFYSRPQKVERMVFELGDEKGQRLKSKPAYYQVFVDEKRARVVLDLSQVVASQITPDSFKQLAIKSPLIKNARMIYDPEDQGLMMELLLKNNVSAKVMELPGARLALDLTSKNK